MNRILPCTFPFPDQSPPVQVADACEHCPNADRKILDQHASMEQNDPELQAAIRSFAGWFFHPDQDKDTYEVKEMLRYAANLYTREDHTGTCIPKTILFAYYKGLQYMDREDMPRLSDDAAAALRGEPVPSWPDGEVRGGRTWNQMFVDYTARYD